LSDKEQAKVPVAQGAEQHFYCGGILHGRHKSFLVEYITRRFGRNRHFHA
jgi:hypothetical protein